MCAIGRALMSKPETVLLDEPSMGLAPQLVEEIFEIVKDLNEKEGVSFLLAEQNTNVALRFAHYGYIERLKIGLHICLRLFSYYSDHKVCLVRKL